MRDTTNKDNNGDDDNVPVIDFSNKSKSELSRDVSHACQAYGFFQVINHGIPNAIIEELRIAMKDFFNLSKAQKDVLRRNKSNARGYFDDELTKRKRDWKECLDVGIPGSKDWNLLPDNHPENACLDGFNQFPKELPNVRSTVVQYFQACEALSHEIAVYMSLGLGVSQEKVDNDNADEDNDATRIVHLLRKDHTSFLRMNYYPPCCNNDDDDSNKQNDQSPLGISPHTDAGFVTVLIQDDGCHSLQVAKHRQANDNVGSSLEWITVRPVPGALTINTGDMCAIWSNGLYKAPLHRVLTNAEKPRFSAPFFYNPPYRTVISPLPYLLHHLSSSDTNNNDNDSTNYVHPCVWGYFRAVRFAGDLTDFGTEIQISDYAKGSTSTNPIKQEKFLKEANFNEPFSVEKYRSLLVENDSGVKAVQFGSSVGAGTTTM